MSNNREFPKAFFFSNPKSISLKQSFPKDEKPTDQRKVALNHDNIIIGAENLKLDGVMDYKQAQEDDPKNINQQVENSLTSKHKDEKRTDQGKAALNSENINQIACLL